MGNITNEIILRNVRNQRDAAIKIVEFVAKNYEYETEYDGRMESYCFYCGEYQDKKEKHLDDCLHLEAKKLGKDV